MDKFIDEKEREKAIVSACDLIAYIKTNQLNYPCLGDDLWDFANEQTEILMKDKESA